MRTDKGSDDYIDGFLDQIKEKQMNKFESYSGFLQWFMALLLVALVAGCGGGGGKDPIMGGGGTGVPGGGGGGLSSDKAITAYSLAGAAGNINETAKTIAVTVPFGTPLTAQVATFTTTGTGVMVGGVTQASGTTPNNFTNPVPYIVTAADGTTATYNVTVTVAAAAGPVVCTGAPNCVDLGTAANFAILTNTGITDAVGSAVITGNIGVSDVTTGASIIVTCPELVVGAGIGQMFTRDAAPVNTCLSTDKTAGNIAAGDMGTAYTAANAVGGGPGVGAACPGAGDFSGLAIAPGVYTCIGVTIPTNFTLAGTGAATDVWVFKLSGTLGMTGGAGMTFTGAQGALPQNVFWAVAGAVSIGVGSTLEGVVLGALSIDTLAGSIVHGRLLSQTAVNLQGGTNVVTQP